MILLACILQVALGPSSLSQDAVHSAAALAAAVRDGAEGATIPVAPGLFELEAPLELKAGMTLKGAGLEKTILTHVAGWKPSTQTLPDPEMTTKGMDTQAFLIRLKEKAANIANNRLTNVSDTDRYANALADRPAGLEAPLKFECGVGGEITVDGWQAKPTSQQ